MTPQNNNKNGLFTLRFSLGTAFIGIAVLTSVTLGVITFFSVRSFVRQGVRERLADAVGIAVLKIDADAHSTLRERADENTTAYHEIRKYLRDIRDKAKDIRFVYTIRLSQDGRVIFVVDAEESAMEISHLGDVYEEATDLLRKTFTKPYAMHIEERFHTDKWGTFISGYAPIMKKNGELEAVLGMDISAQNVLEYERQYLSMIFLVGLVVCAMAVAIGVFISRRISKPLMLLEEDMSRIQTFDLDSNLVIRSRIVEVMKMKNALDNMKNGLRSFKKYVPADLVAELVKLGKEAVLGAEKRELSVFFSDIKDFSSIAEGVSPEQLAQNMGVYFEGMTGTLLRNKGTVDKFIGDAIMAFWGAPVPAEDHATLACHSALQCQRCVDAMSADWAKTGMPPFVTRIGISTGEAIVGNIGYKDRLSYTAIGDIVNLASRLEGLNKHYGTRILISDATHALVWKDFVTRPVDIVAVKGKNTEVRIHELIAEKDDATKDTLAFASLCEEGVSLYLRREWAKAKACFLSALEMKPGDKVSQILCERCAVYEQTPPPLDWRGVTVMREK